MSRFLFNARAAAALALAVLLVGVAARADVIILKDGFVIQGVKTVKEKEAVIDMDAGFAGLMLKPNGMTAVDDGPRWVVFPNSARQVADVSDVNRFKDFAAYTRDRVKGDLKLPSTAVNPVDTKPWDYKEWTKEVKYDDLTDRKAKHTVRLHINVITPYYLRIGSSSHRLARYVLLKEWEPDRIRKFIVNHPDLIEKPGKPDPDRREKLIRFWIQADFLDEADKDLTELLAALPAEKERHARLRSEVNALRAEKLMAEIERARESGRHQWAIKALEAFPAAFPKEDVPKGVALKANNLRAEYDTRTRQLAAARRYLDELTRAINPATNAWLRDAAAAVRAETHLDTLSRLDMFLTLADRAEKDSKAGRRPSQSPEELLSAAVTGWHLGKVAAEAKVDTAYRVWMTRQMALQYLRTPSVAGRQQVLKGWLGGPNAVKYDELEKLISLLPPPEAPPTLPTGTVSVHLPPTVELQGGVQFLLRLPDEYQPGRSYPLLVLLPDPVDDQAPPASQMQGLLDRLGDWPSRHGYIVAVPQWWPPQKFRYEYSKEEQGAVMAVLSHLRRAYQVDSDRIFVWGNGEGGSLALDLGGSHPDTFAGIVPVNPSVVGKLYITCEYWANFHQVPVYLVMGDQFGPSVNAIRMVSERWMPRGFPTLVTSYKGRGREWFAGELPLVFDWMGRKRRADPGKMVGPPANDRVKEGFSSVRFSDNRFHWLSAEIKPERVVTPASLFDVKAPVPAPVKITATIADGNTIKAKAIGARNLTVWFGRGMVDYTKPVKVLVADSKPVTQLITPEIPVLMEDLYERADRQRPYFARLEFKVP